MLVNALKNLSPSLMASPRNLLLSYWRSKLSLCNFRKLLL